MMFARNSNSTATSTCHPITGHHIAPNSVNAARALLPWHVQNLAAINLFESRSEECSSNLNCDGKPLVIDCMISYLFRSVEQTVTENVTE